MRLAPRRRPRRPFQPMTEALEGRQLLAAAHGALATSHARESAVHALAGRAAPKAKFAVTSVAFTSGVGPVYHSPPGNTLNYYTPPYPTVQWQGNARTGQASVNAPLVQPVAGPPHFVQAVVGLSLPGVRRGTPFRLFGTSNASYLNFDVQGKLSVNAHGCGRGDRRGP